MALSPGDPHSYARPELARVTHTHLELNVDFGLKVLQGKAILDIEWEPSSNEIILDSYGLVVSSVTDTLTQINLEHQVGHCGTLGSKFAIQLLQNVNYCNNRCRIQIEYKTRPSSPALYWLTPEQTANGNYSFLLSNNKLTYARAWFPCQDTPSIKTTYSAMVTIFGNFGPLERLLPTSLIGLSPDEGTRFVPYEKGYMFLIELQNILDKQFYGNFRAFLKFYLTKFSQKSINTNDWKSYLYSYFPKRLLELNSIDWNFWFDDPNNYPPRLFDTANTKLETVCISLAERWINWDDAADLQSTFGSTDIKYFCHRQKVYFLYYLHASHTILSVKKIESMAQLYQFNYQNDEIRFIWLRLCIKSRWRIMVPAALIFAIKFCSPKFTYPIFQDLYKWSD
ncbi:leukotriene A-4 hydrolase-like, partial [Temnothorax curvispinosus]|uniref:Leukotriene A-4 hydrolase-like n=1 Tax=Temnothorax curvispinosus TaxID=300111 RepID=A0A6J1QF59_9HYME